MLRYLILLVFVFTRSTDSSAQQGGDTLLMVRLPDVQVKDMRKWNNDTARYRFNQMRYYVKTILPYLTAGTALFTELDQRRNDPALSRKERKRFVSQKEDQVRDQFEDKIKALNETQGLLLMKLLARQTGANIYAMLSDFKNPLTALKWQAWARLHGFNLNKKYDPGQEPLLEQVMLSLDYPLPGFYGEAETASAPK